MTDALSLHAGDARVDLAPAVGGAIARFAFRQRDVLRPVSPESRAAGNVRGHACYPLVPYSNRISDATFDFAGHTHRLARNFGDSPHAIHGVGWQRPWRIEAHDDRSAILVLDHPADEEGIHAWPWPFRATQSLVLTADRMGATLAARLTLANTGATPFPFGLGYHPFFPRTATTQLTFSADEVWETDATQLPTRRVPIPDAWRFDRPRRVADVALDNVFCGWRGEATLRNDDAGFTVAIAADRAASFLVVYVPPGRDFLAVEPVTHMTDAFNRAARGESGTGARVLAAGAAFSCTMRLCVRASP